jgi:hypothetical protein
MGNSFGRTLPELLCTCLLAVTFRDFVHAAPTLWSSTLWLGYARINACVQSGSKAAQVPHLEAQIAEMTTRLKNMESQMTKLRQASSDSDVDVAKALEARLQQEQETNRILRSQVSARNQPQESAMASRHGVMIMPPCSWGITYATFIRPSWEFKNVNLKVSFISVFIAATSWLDCVVWKAAPKAVD